MTMIGVKTIKKLSKKGKLKLQSKLENVSSYVRSRNVKKIIFVAVMGITIGYASYTYPPSKRVILAIKSKLTGMDILDNAQAIKSEPSMVIEDYPFSLVAGMIIFTTMYSGLSKFYNTYL